MECHKDVELEHSQEIPHEIQPSPGTSQDERPNSSAGLIENPKESEEMQELVDVVGNYHHTTDLLVKSETKQLIEMKVSQEVLTKTAADLEAEIHYEMNYLNCINNSISQQNNMCDGQLQNDRVELSNARKEVENTSKMIELLENTVENVEEKMKDLSIKIKNFSAQNGKKSHANVDEYRDKIDDKKRRIQKLKNDLRIKRENNEAKIQRRIKLETVRKEIENINNKTITLDKSINEMTKLKFNAEEKLSKADGVVQAIRDNKVKEMEMRNRLLQAAENEKAHLAEKLARLESTSQAIRNQIENHQEEVSANQKIISNLEEKLENGKNELRLLDDKIAEVQGTCDKKRVEFEEKLSLLRNESESKNQILANSNAALNGLSEKIEFLKTDYLEKCEEKNALLERMIEFNAIQHQNRLIYAERKGIFDNLHEKCSSLEMGNGELVNKIADKENEVPKLKECLTKQTEIIEKNRTEINKLRKCLEKALFKPDDNKNQLNNLQNQLDEKIKMLDDLQNQKKEIEEKLQDDEQRLEKITSELENLKRQSDLNEPKEKKVKFNDVVSIKSATESTDFSQTDFDVRSLNTLLSAMLSSRE